MKHCLLLLALGGSSLFGGSVSPSLIEAVEVVSSRLRRNRIFSASTLSSSYPLHSSVDEPVAEVANSPASVPDFSSPKQPALQGVDGVGTGRFDTRSNNKVVL